MQSIINIDGKEILMEANGGTLRAYRSLFGGDLLTALHGAIAKDGEVLDVEVFENLAFCMAKQAGSVECDIETWLSQFDSAMAIVNSVGDIMRLWRGNMKTTATPKKKASKTTEK